jgi:transcriptional regulator GlxA family with amidase domain
MSLYYEKTGNAALTVAYRDSLRLNEQRERENLATASTLLEKKEEKAGFGTLRTFQRNFTAQYNMSPKDYRAAAGEKK